MSDRMIVERLRYKDAVVESDNTLCDEAVDEIERLTAENAALRSRLAEAEALLREESYEQYRFTQMTEYPSVTRMLLWHMDRRRRIDAFLLSDSATHREDGSHG